MRRKKKRRKTIVPKSVRSMRDPIVSDLVACKAAFDQVKIPWVITDGIVLGYVKFRDIIPWDTDLDLAVFQELTDLEWKSLFAALKKAGFGIRDLKQDFVYGRRRVKFNLWLFHRNGNFYEAFPAMTPGLKFVEKATWYNEPQLVKFLGDIYPMPNHLDDYINCRYGEGWLNRSHTHDEWRLIKFGTRDQSVGIGQKIWLKSRCGKDGDLWPKILKRGDTL